MTTQLHGIGEFIKRLEAIAEACGEKPTGKDAIEKDEFLRTKQRIYVLLEKSREDIRERQTLLKKRGNCYETIQKGHSVRQDLEELKRLLPQLEKLHKRAQGKRSANARKEELQARYKDIRILRKLVDEVDNLFITCNSGADAPGSLCNPNASLLGLQSGLRDTGRASDEDARRGMTGDEEEALANMKKRDAELDGQVAEIGSVLERLDPLARQIGMTADRQRMKAEGLTEDVEKAENDIEGLNKKITEVMQYEKNTNMCCQMILGIAVLCCVGFIFQQLKM